MEEKFTPGPWKTNAAKTVGSQWRVCSENDTEIAFCEDPDAYANAHLIAAAPELYHALLNALMVTDGVMDGDLATDGISIKGAIKEARAAFAKARGETS